MTRPWEAEHVVDAELARRLVESRFPELAPAWIEPFGVGFDNTAYRVNGALVFRFPRRSLGVDAMAIEMRLLPQLAGRLPLAVPDPEWRGEPTEAFPWPWAGYRQLAGTTSCAADPSEAALGAAAVPLAAFLAVLHAIPPEEVGAPGDTIARADLDRRKPRAREALGALEVAGRIDDATPWLERLAEPTPPPTGATRLLHGDLYARHILVDDGCRPVGILDWGDVHAGDPAVDLHVAFGFLPASARAAFLDAYGAVDPVTWIRARHRAVIHAAFVAQYAHEVEDAPLLRAGLRALAHALE